MNLDSSDGTTGTGTFTMSNFELIGNGMIVCFILMHLIYVCCNFLIISPCLLLIRLRGVIPVELDLQVPIHLLH